MKFGLILLLAAFCAAAPGAGEMVFASMPHSAGEAEDGTAWLAGTVGEDKIIIMEPAPKDSFDLERFARGEYDGALNASFAGLKRRGLAGRKLGLWVPFPELNNVCWDRNHPGPEYSVPAFNRYGKLFKSYFPDGRLGPLLDMSTQGSPGDYRYAPLAPFLEGIDSSLVDSLGIQGFPWLPLNGSGQSSELDAAVFLDHDVVIESAKYLGVKKVWLNTGVPYSRWDNGTINVVLEPDRWANALDGILEQALIVKNDGWVGEVKINIFAENKSLAAEGTDWSLGNDPARRQIFTDFVRESKKHGINITVFGAADCLSEA